MKIKRSLVKTLLAAWCALCAASAADEVVAQTKSIIVKGGNKIPTLNTLLAPTVRDYGPYQLIASRDLTEGRAIASLIDNTLVNFISFSTNLEREKQLLPIMLPLNDGLLGYRICLIRKGTQHKFDALHSLQDWRQTGLTIGTGAHWSDTPILAANHLKLRKAVSHDLLLDMLIAKRFDCFPRGLDEIVGPNRPKYERKGAVVEKNLLLVYPFRSLFFVSRKDPQLAERIKTGYRRALADGTWQAHIDDTYAELENLVRPLQLKERIIIRLENPFISEAAKKIPPLAPFIQDIAASGTD